MDGSVSALAPLFTAALASEEDQHSADHYLERGGQPAGSLRVSYYRPLPGARR